METMIAWLAAQIWEKKSKRVTKTFFDSVLAKHYVNFRLSFMGVAFFSRSRRYKTFPQDMASFLPSKLDHFIVVGKRVYNDEME